MTSTYRTDWRVKGGLMTRYPILRVVMLAQHWRVQEGLLMMKMILDHTKHIDLCWREEGQWKWMHKQSDPWLRWTGVRKRREVTDWLSDWLPDWWTTEAGKSIYEFDLSLSSDGQDERRKEQITGRGRGRRVDQRREMQVACQVVDKWDKNQVLRFRNKEKRNSGV